MLNKAFRDSALEREYQTELAPEKVRQSRVLVLLALVMNLIFATLDNWAAPDALIAVWIVRAVISITCLAVLAATWHPAFPDRYEPIMIVFFLGIGTGINALIAVAEPTDFAAEAYYGGLLLINFGLYTLSHLSLRVSVLISLLLTACYAAIAVFIHDFLAADKVLILITALYFCLGSTVVGLVAKGILQRYAKENYLLRHSLQRDIVMREEEQRRAAYLADHDALTDLPNRRAFHQQASALLARAAQRGERLAVLFLDLDQFKPVNDRYGHATGDRVLKIIGERLRSALRSGDALARFGGDEFVAAIPITDCPDPVVDKLHAAIEAPVNLDGIRVHLTASIGVAVYPDDGETLEALLRSADDDMYRQKGLNRSLAVLP